MEEKQKTQGDLRREALCYKPKNGYDRLNPQEEADMNAYCEELGIKHDEAVFVGDDYGPGGNDESVYLSDFGFVKVDDYTKLGEYLKDYL